MVCMINIGGVGIVLFSLVLLKIWEIFGVDRMFLRGLLRKLFMFLLVIWIIVFIVVIFVSCFSS